MVIFFLNSINSTFIFQHSSRRKNPFLHHFPIFLFYSKFSDHFAPSFMCITFSSRFLYSAALQTSALEAESSSWFSGYNSTLMILNTSIQPQIPKFISLAQIFFLSLFILLDVLQASLLCLVIQSCPTPWTVANLCPWGFSRQEYWSGLPHPPSGDLPNPGIKPRSPTLQVDFLPAEPQGKPENTRVGSVTLLQGNFSIQELNWGCLRCRWIFYQLSYQGSPELHSYEWLNDEYYVMYILS